MQLALRRRGVSRLLSRREACQGGADRRDQPGDRWRSCAPTGRGDRRRLWPGGRLAEWARCGIYPRQPDQLAWMGVGATARRGCRPGLARTRPRPAGRPARRAVGRVWRPPIPRHPRRRAANGNRALRRRHCTARRFGGRLQGRRRRHRRWRLSRKSGAFPALHRAASGPRVAAQRGDRGRRRPAHGARRGCGRDGPRPVLRPSVEPRRDDQRRSLPLSRRSTRSRRRGSSSAPTAAGWWTRAKAGSRSPTGWRGSRTRCARPSSATRRSGTRQAAPRKCRPTRSSSAPAARFIAPTRSRHSQALPGCRRSGLPTR